MRSSKHQKKDILQIELIIWIVAGVKHKTAANGHSILSSKFWTNYYYLTVAASCEYSSIYTVKIWCVPNITRRENMTQTSLKVRNSNIEILRILAMFQVLMLHVNFMTIGEPTTAESITNPVPTFFRVFFSNDREYCCKFICTDFGVVWH